MMKQRLLIILLALSAIVSSACAQVLSVEDIEVQTGGQATLVANLMGATNTSALQFCLNLPTGMTADVSDATLGTATEGHFLKVETLASGDLLFIVYNMNFRKFKNGELLRLPLTVCDGDITSKGKIYNIRTATPDAVSYSYTDVSFSVAMEQESICGDVNGDGDVNLEDVTIAVSHILGQTPEGFVEAAADIDGNGVVDIQDLVTIIDIVLK